LKGREIIPFNFLEKWLIAGLCTHKHGSQEGLAPTDVWLGSCGTAGKPGGNGEHNIDLEHRKRLIDSTVLIKCLTQVNNKDSELFTMRDNK
jgi:hypothetical protein